MLSRVRYFGSSDADVNTGLTNPKLEDFLRGSGPDVSHFPDETAAVYDSELKTIAASFLHGFSSDNQHQPALTPTPVQQDNSLAKKAVDTFGQRTSIYRGVTRHRWTGRYEAHLWDNSCRREGQSRKGRQGGYDKEDKAARAYDLAALKYWGLTTTTNFPVCNYEKELVEMKNMTRQEFVASLRSKFFGAYMIAKFVLNFAGKAAGFLEEPLFIGALQGTQEEAAEAYDIAAIKFRGLNAVTNFDMSRYDVNSIANKNLPIGGMCSKSKTSMDQTGPDTNQRSASLDLASSSEQPTNSNVLSFELPMKPDPSTDYWNSNSVLGYSQSYQGTTPYVMEYYSSEGFNQQENHSGGTVALSSDQSSIPIGPLWV
ncbi:hypothetical protein L1987_64909 [Smallanthus sonchifolius]|uniref:Uncharacterized protein n=1 Tax=Smallanthus sonchifolius TaxID=185202 RepID=A0ACB9BT06_9ASTR|nr:hypothetical protein L1987_64909 [Smallanthus sonchifolius]